MQCYESYAIRLKIYSDLKAIQPRAPFDELVLSDVMDIFSIDSITDLNSLSTHYYQKLLNDALAWMVLSTKIAA